ncbi:unnamed protein product, partial [Polarella glacialis]
DGRPHRTWIRGPQRISDGDEEGLAQDDGGPDDGLGQQRHGGDDGSLIEVGHSLQRCHQIGGGRRRRLRGLRGHSELGDSIHGGGDHFGESWVELGEWIWENIGEEAVTARVNCKLWLTDKATGKWEQKGMTGKSGRFWLVLDHVKVGEDWKLKCQTALSEDWVVK